MLTPKMEQSFNDQINAEMYSGYLYLSMCTYFQDLGLNGFASWMKAQCQEELFHAMKMFDFVFERGGKVELEAIEKPKVTWKSPLDVFQATLKHEQMVTGRINDMVNLAIEEKDHASNIFLQWFVTEQVEEEDSVGDILNKIELIGDNKSALFLMDQELGSRVFTPPAE